MIIAAEFIEFLVDIRQGEFGVPQKGQAIHFVGIEGGYVDGKEFHLGVVEVPF